MTALDHRVAAERGEASTATRATECVCCELPIESCGTAYARRAGVNLKATDRAVAAWVASTADEEIDDGHDPVTWRGEDVQHHSDDFHDYDARERFKAERSSKWAPE